MPYSLRTRLYLPVALLLAFSIAASSVLSRRATLVEVREMVKQTAGPASSLTVIKAGVEAQLARGTTLRDALVDAAAAHGRPLVVVNGQTVAAASNPDLAAAHVREASADGALVLDVTEAGAVTAMAIRGARPADIIAPGGEVLGMLYALPPAEGRVPAARVAAITPLLWINLAVIAAALGLTFVLSRQILGPVSALKAAAERMRQGELDVQVPVCGRDEIADLGRTFNTMASRLADTERLRRQMVSDVAHELRSPVTNLRCTLEAIQDGLAPADRASIDALHEETLFLQRLIADLQDLALAEAGRLELHLGDVNIGEIVRRATAVMANAIGAPISVDLAPDLPQVRGDADRLEQVLRNLLSNARRHTPADGSIVISAACVGERARITVSDTGAGIAPDHVPYVFDRFYRADPSRARATGGAGLGLAIARQLVAAHGGTIAAASGGTGMGATFTIDLPLAG